MGGLCLFYSLLGQDGIAAATALRESTARYIRDNFNALLEGSTMSYADIANFEFNGWISAQRYEAILTHRETIAADDKAHWGGFCELYAHCQKHNTARMCMN